MPTTKLTKIREFHTQSTSRVGIIDIGSNSLRLVVYDSLKRASVPLYNEKVMCQLGKGLSSTGRLNPEGAQLARKAVRRFLAMARNMEANALHVMATAAVREAKDGKDFSRELEEEHGIHIDIISGDREAKLGAFGICSSVHEPHGVTGDLGGGSMELVKLKDNELLEHATLPIGPLRLVDETGGDRAKLRRTIKQAFEQVEWLKKTKMPEFYAIGGSFRAIARLHMHVTNYPLHILHQYTLPSADFAAFAAELASFPDARVAELPGISGKRVPSIVPAAMILEYMVSQIQPKNIVFSASGIREGYLYEKLPPYMRKQDGLLASCTDMVNRFRTYSHYAGELMVWMQPLLEDGESEANRRLRLAFCLLSDIAHHIHPEYRAEFAMQRILQSSFTCLDHAERMQLALALYHRYQFKMKDDHPALALIGPKARAWAKLVGSAANLAYHLTGGVDGSLHFTTLKVEKKSVKLLITKGAEDLMGEAINKRINGVEEAYRKWVS